MLHLLVEITALQFPHHFSVPQSSFQPERRLNQMSIVTMFHITPFHLQSELSLVTALITSCLCLSALSITELQCHTCRSGCLVSPICFNIHQLFPLCAPWAVQLFFVLRNMSSPQQPATQSSLLIKPIVSVSHKLTSLRDLCLYYYIDIYHLWCVHLYIENNISYINITLSFINSI